MSEEIPPSRVHIFKPAEAPHVEHVLEANTIAPIQPPPPARASIGYLEEYFSDTGYLGNRVIDDLELQLGPQFEEMLARMVNSVIEPRLVKTRLPLQLPGSEYIRTFVLDSDLEIKRSFTKTRMLKAGQIVKRIIQPLQGREVSRPGGRW